MAKAWAQDPTYSQQKPAKPTYTDPEDDMQTDPVVPIGSTSKTWNSRTDGQLLPRQSGSEEEWVNSSASPRQVATEVEGREVFL